jgi:hypothetical protein
VRRLRLASFLFAAVLLISARPAAAQTFESCDKQESVALSDQYCQPELPNPGGAEVPPASPVEQSLPPGVVAKLERAGVVGELLLDLPRIAPPSVVRAQAGGLARKIVDANKLLAMGALGARIKPESAGKILVKTAAVGEGFAKTFRWGLLVTTFLLVGASWRRHRTGSVLG